MASGTCLAMASAAAGAAGVRSAISSAVRPPATSARASGTASDARSMVMTGISGAARSSASSRGPPDLRGLGLCRCHARLSSAARATGIVPAGIAERGMIAPRWRTTAPASR